VGFIKYEKVKIQRFLSGLTSFYKENIQYVEPRTLTETIRKDKYLYVQGKGRESMQKSWKDNKKEKYEQRKKGFKPPFNRNSPNKNHPDQYAKDEYKREDSLGKMRIPLVQCWGCKVLAIKMHWYFDVCFHHSSLDLSFSSVFWPVS
jgi:hypothetical protein